MTVTPRTISLSAALLLLLATPLVAVLGGGSFAAGFAAAGGLVLVNLWLWVVLGKQAFRLVLGGGRPLLAAVILPLKFIALLGVLALLVRTFPPLSVLLGASVVVAALMMVAVVGLRTDLQVGEGHP